LEEAYAKAITTLNPSSMKSPSNIVSEYYCRSAPWFGFLAR